MSLNPSQRITLMKEIAGRLSSEDWPLIDVTLKQFGFPWSDEWRGTKDAYILQMISESEDGALISIAQHVGFHLERPLVPGLEPPFWRKGMFKLFVSHLAVHRIFATELQEALINYGISAFVAHSDIEPTLEWQTQIETALATCESLIALLHEDFHASDWTDQEIGFAMGRGLPVYAIRFGQDPYGFIGRFQAFNGNDKKGSELARELFEAYRKNKQTQRRMAEVLIGLFEDSASFANAKLRIGFLEQLEVWEPSFSSRIISAAKSNSQISGSWGVPDRVTSLVNKWSKSGV